MDLSQVISESINIKPWCVTIQKALANYPQLHRYLNDGKLDFGDSVSLKVYNQAVAYTLAKLYIDVPPNHLIPTICLRHAYVKIIADLTNRGDTILDIGTGASAIISLLAAKLHKLNVVATEINPVSIESARNNIRRNNLGKSIKLITSKGGIIKQVIPAESHFSAILTYPPTYKSSSQDRGKLKKIRGFRGVSSEMLGGGKEGMNFISQLIEEATCDYITVKHISVLCLFHSHVIPTINLLENCGRTVRTIELIAGTRKRYLVIGS